MLIASYAFVVSLVSALLQAANPDLITLYPDQLEPIYVLGVAHGITAFFFLALHLIVRRRGARRSLPRVLLVSMPVLLLLSVDRILNAVWPPPPAPLTQIGVFVPHPRRGWTHKPLSHGRQDDVEAYIDRYGMRVKAFDWQRTLGDGPRILFLGDSVTFGYNVPAEDCFVERVQTLLDGRENESDFIAMNGGTMSATPRQELDWLTHEGAAVLPDLVVVQICMNDVTYMLHPSVLADDDKELVMIAQTYEPPHWSALMRLAYDWGRRRTYGDDLGKAAEIIATENFEKLLDGKRSKSMWAAWDRATRDWKKMATFCKSRGIPIAFMIVPLRAQIRDRDVSDEPQKRICEFAEQQGVPCLDLLPVFRSMHLDEGVPMDDLYSDYTHPSTTGHRIYADLIVQFMSENDLLAQARSHRDRSQEE